MKFLISALGGDIAQSIAQIIRSEYPDAQIFGLDISNKNAARFFCDEFILAPKATNESYIKFIKKCINDFKIDFFIPCSEIELRELIKVEDTETKSKIVSVRDGILNICLNKLLTYKFLNEKDILVPWFCEDVQNIKNYPCIYKGQQGAGSKSINKVNDAKSASALKSLNPDGVFQEYLSDECKEITCALFRWDGQFSCIQLERILKDGVTSWAQKIEIESISEFCEKISLVLDLEGAINVQLRLVNNRPMLLEINPRFSSTVGMRHQLGFKDLVWTIESRLGKKIDFENINYSNREIVRTFNFVTL